MSATTSLDDECKRFNPYTYELLLNEETRLHQTGKSKGSSPVARKDAPGNDGALARTVEGILPDHC